MNTKVGVAQAGVPTGGITGQSLVKLSPADNDVGWGTGGGGGIMGAGNQFLPIGEYRQTGGSSYTGDEFGGNVFRDTATNRIYTAIQANAYNSGLRIWKNDYGSYYLENFIIVSNAWTTDPTYTVNMVIWTTDNIYLYALVAMVKAGNNHKIDVIRFDLDGTNPIAINIYTGLGIIRPDSLRWLNAGADFNTMCACVVGTKLYTTYSIYNGGIGDYERKIREYDITNPVFNVVLANTYSVPGGGNADEARNMTYDSGTSTFYISGGNSGSGINEYITKFQIVGANFNWIANNSYSEFNYGAIGEATGQYWICNLEFTPTSYTIYVVDNMISNRYSGASNRMHIVYWLTSYTYPLW